MAVSFKVARTEPCIAATMELESRTPPQAAALTRTSVLVALAVSAALVWSLFSGDLVHELPLPKVPYLRSGVATLSDLIMMTGLAALAARRSPAWVLSLTGVANLRWRQFGWAVLVFAPIVAIAAAVTHPAARIGASDIVWPGVLGPFAEELFYRGLAIGLLMRAAGWLFAPAALWPALVFGAAHLYQGEHLLDTAEVVAITAVSGLGLGWLYVRWGFALWPAILTHIVLNCLWTVFDLGDTAVGGVLGNVLRGLALLLAIGLTLWLAPRRTPAS